MTADAQREDRERCLAAGMDDYLSKPVQMAEMERILAHWTSASRGDTLGSPRVVNGISPEAVLDAAVLAQIRALEEPGETSLLAELVETFRHAAPGYVVRLNAALAAGDATGFKEAAHVLTGSAATLGATRLRVAAYDLELRGGDHNLTGAGVQLMALETACAEALEASSPAVRLFVERAWGAAPNIPVIQDAAIVGRICSRLEGLPLAIELAAARVRTLGLDQILERLDDRVHLLVGGSRTASGRQQTLLATLNWSYGLLAERESIVFRQLGVFAGSWSLSAAEAVCANDRVAQRDVLDSLERLVDKSLVVVDQRERLARYRLLEPVRQYANGQLIASGESAGARRKHALHYAEFAEARSRDTNIGGSRRFEATAELAGEYPNMRLALAYLVENGESQLGLRLAFNLLFLWQVQEALSEPRTWLSGLLALPSADEPTEARAGGLVTAARIAEMAGDITAAQAFCAEALPLARGLGIPLLEFLALIFSTNTRAQSETR